MTIGSIGTGLPVPAHGTSAATRQSDKPAAEAGARDTVAITGTADEALTYTDPRKNATQQASGLSTMLDESNRQVQQFLQLLGDLIQQQGLEWSKLATGEQKLTVDQATIDAATEATSEDGEWGMRQTAERILSFAKLGIGDDPAQIATYRAAVDQGFKEAEKVFGGKLPDISYQTYDAIMAEFDRWEQEGIPPGATVSLAKAMKPDATDSEASSSQT